MSMNKNTVERMILKTKELKKETTFWSVIITKFRKKVRSKRLEMINKDINKKLFKELFYKLSDETYNDIVVKDLGIISSPSSHISYNEVCNLELPVSTKKFILYIIQTIVDSKNVPLKQFVFLKELLKNNKEIKDIYFSMFDYLNIETNNYSFYISDSEKGRIVSIAKYYNKYPEVDIELSKKSSSLINEVKLTTLCKDELIRDKTRTSLLRLLINKEYDQAWEDLEACSYGRKLNVIEKVILVILTKIHFYNVAVTKSKEITTVFLIDEGYDTKIFSDEYLHQFFSIGWLITDWKKSSYYYDHMINQTSDSLLNNYTSKELYYFSFLIYIADSIMVKQIRKNLIKLQKQNNKLVSGINFKKRILNTYKGKISFAFK
jgi:hypothetical protein